MSKIKIELSQDEGMILLEFLQESNDANKIKRSADKRVVWDLICIIEKQIDSILSPDYKKHLEAARRKIN